MSSRVWLPTAAPPASGGRQRTVLQPEVKPPPLFIYYPWCSPLFSNPIIFFAIHSRGIICGRLSGDAPRVSRRVWRACHRVGVQTDETTAAANSRFNWFCFGFFPRDPLTVAAVFARGNAALDGPLLPTALTPALENMAVKNALLRESRGGGDDQRCFAAPGCGKRSGLHHKMPSFHHSSSFVFRSWWKL